MSCTPSVKIGQMTTNLYPVGKMYLLCEKHNQWQIRFVCRLSDRWRLVTCLSEMTLALKTLVKNTFSYLLYNEK